MVELCSSWTSISESKTRTKGREIFIQNCLEISTSFIKCWPILCLAPACLFTYQVICHAPSCLFASVVIDTWKSQATCFRCLQLSSWEGKVQLLGVLKHLSSCQVSALLCAEWNPPLKQPLSHLNLFFTILVVHNHKKIREKLSEKSEREKRKSRQKNERKIQRNSEDRSEHGRPFLTLMCLESVTVVSGKNYTWFRRFMRSLHSLSVSSINPVRSAVSLFGSVWWDQFL